MSGHTGISRRQLMRTAATVAVAGQVYLHAPKAAFAQKASRLKVACTPPSTQTTLGFRTTSEGSGPLSAMYEFLTNSDRFTGEIGPMLATEWESSADGMEWRFKLRSGVAFHDGTPFTARDVVKSWELVTREDSRTTTASLFRKLIASRDKIEVVNDHEIVFHLERPEPELPYYLCEKNGLVIYSAAYWDSVGEEGYAAKPIGTGPFTFVEFREGQHILFRRVDNHWRKTPEFAELQLLYMPEDSTRLAALLAGEVHIAEIARSVQNQAIARGKEIVTSTLPAAIISAKFGGNALSNQGKAGPLTNKLVRQAMNMAIDRDEINKQIFGGRGTVATVESYMPNDPLYSADWKPYPFDPQKARALLAEAGFPDGFEFTMTIAAQPGYPEVPTVCEALGIYFSNVGLKPKFVEFEWKEFINHQRGADFDNTVFTARQSIKPLFRSMEYFWSEGVYHFFEDPYLEERLGRFFQSVDPKERQQIMVEVGNFLYRENATMPLLYLNGEVAIDPAVVAEYKADTGAFGATIGHEYTKAA